MARLGRLVRQRRARVAEDVFVAEGAKVLHEALEVGASISEVFVADDATLGPFEQSVVDAAAQRGALVDAVAGGKLRSLLDAVTPQPIAAVVRRPAPEPAVLEAASLVLVLAGVADPGNAGTLVRSAVAAGADAVVCTKGTVDLWSPKCVRSSGGLVVRVPVLEDLDVSSALERLRSSGLRAYGTAVEGADPYDEVDLLERVAFVLGSEAHGLPAALDDELDGWVTIPMVGDAESLNVAMAGTLLCFEALRQRRTRGIAPR